MAKQSSSRSVVIPPQSTPALDPSTGAINKTWWLALQAQNALVNNLAAASAAPSAGGFAPALTIVSNAVTLDLSLGVKFELTLNQAAQVTVNNPIYTGGTLTTGASIWLYIIEDATGGRPTPAWGTAFGQDVATQQIDTTIPNTRSSFAMSLHPDGLWHLDSTPTTGQPLS